MNFEPTDEQAALADSVRRVLADHCRFEQRRAIVATPHGRSPELFAHLAQLGLTALCVPEAQGGFGARAEDLLPVLQACGAALLPEPLLGSAVLATTALAHADAALQARWLPLLAQGRTLLAWAHDEAGAGHADPWTETSATAQAGAWRLHGAKINVLHAASARAFVVSARVAGQAGDALGRALFLVEADTAGLRRRDHRLVDDTPAAELQLDAAAALPLFDPTDAAVARRAFDAVRAIGMAALCADMLGAAEMAYRLAVDYLNVRKQFGRTLGSNQALRHRAADMLVSLESARAMAIAAAVAADRPLDEGSAADLHRAKFIVGRHARQVAHHAIQCHGGIGMTEEYAVGHCLRRIHVADQLFGDAEAHARRLAALLQAGAAVPEAA